MTSLPFLFGSAFVIGLSGALMPGPVLTATIAAALRRGFVAGPLIVAGHALLELLVVAAVVAGLGIWLRQPRVLVPLGLLGGALLVVLGIQTLWSGWRASSVGTDSFDPSASPPKSTWGHPILAGAALSASNPYWLLWWCTIGLNYAALALRRGVWGLAAFYAGHISSDLLWYSLVAAAVSAGRRVCPPVVHGGLLMACGVALVGLGAHFFGDSAGRWEILF